MKIGTCLLSQFRNKEDSDTGYKFVEELKDGFHCYESVLKM